MSGMAPPPPDHRPAAVSAIPREARPYQGLRAGIVSRVLANTVDFVVLVAILAVGYIGLSATLFLWDPSHFHFPAVPMWSLLLIGEAVLFVYLAVSWVMTGGTLGDRLLGLRVVNYRGDRLHLAGAILRSALCVVFPIGVLYTVVSRANRSVADIVLRTSVIYDWGRRGLVPSDRKTRPPA